MTLIILTYLAGILTILSPCILPVLPFVFSRSGQPFVKSSLPLLLGMCFTFTVFSALAVAGGEWVGHANEWGRTVALILLTAFGLSLIFPVLAEKAFVPVTRLGSKIGTSNEGGFASSFLIGISTGFLWAPCAGPILGLVLTGAATQGDTKKSVALLFSYSLGAATSLALALVAGNRFLGRMKKMLGVDQAIKKVLGVAVLVGVVAIFFHLDRTVLTQVSKLETTSIETKLLSFLKSETKENASPEAIEGPLPELSGGTSWLNSKPLTKRELLGKVVLIDFWTYSCINCLRTLPYIKAWAEKYKDDGLVVIGIHAPEFAFEKSEENVKKAIADLGITYPVVLDNQYALWNSFKNKYWPAHYFVDREGQIRHHHFGEGGYEESEEMIRKLLSENGGTIHAKETQIHAKGVEASSVQKDVKSPETYLGSDRAMNQVPAGTPLQMNHWSLSMGAWKIGDEKVTLQKAHGKISFRFHARDLHLVLGSAQKIKFQVRIDGKPPGDNHGMDIDSQGHGEVNGHQLYQLIRQKSETPLTDHLFEIEFMEPGVDAYAFTFG